MKIQEVVCVVDVPYSLKDEKTGIMKNGITRKICFVEYDDSIHGTPLSGIYISKCIPDFSPPIKKRGYLDYDRFGRCNNFRPISDV